MGILAWIVLGLIAGALAKLIMPGDQRGGCIMTTLLGV
ncbi:MAG: GlsB/YeaQ/YmgE family stress response membrane protein, partial [Gemmatimonadota bacterium]